MRLLISEAIWLPQVNEGEWGGERGAKGPAPLRHGEATRAAPLQERDGKTEGMLCGEATLIRFYAKNLVPSARKKIKRSEQSKGPAAP